MQATALTSDDEYIPCIIEVGFRSRKDYSLSGFQGYNIHVLFPIDGTKWVVRPY